MQNKTKQNKTKQIKTKQNKTKQIRTLFLKQTTKSHGAGSTPRTHQLVFLSTFLSPLADWYMQKRQ